MDHILKAIYLPSPWYVCSGLVWASTIERDRAGGEKRERMRASRPARLKTTLIRSFSFARFAFTHTQYTNRPQTRFPINP